MLEARGEEDLATEALGTHPRHQIRREDLHHDAASERLLGRDEHARHPAPAELTFEGVAVAERSLELVLER
jgi:hypothetical protein